MLEGSREFIKAQKVQKRLGRFLEGSRRSKKVQKGSRRLKKVQEGSRRLKKASGRFRKA